MSGLEAFCEAAKALGLQEEFTVADYLDSSQVVSNSIPETQDLDDYDDSESELDRGRMLSQFMITMALTQGVGVNAGTKEIAILWNGEAYPGFKEEVKKCRDKYAGIDPTQMRDPFKVSYVVRQTKDGSWVRREPDQPLYFPRLVWGALMSTYRVEKNIQQNRVLFQQAGLVSNT